MAVSRGQEPFSRTGETAIQKGAQTVTKHGKAAAAVISAEEYQRSVALRKSLADALRACPEDLAPLLGKPPKRIARKVTFG